MTTRFATAPTTTTFATTAHHSSDDVSEGGAAAGVGGVPNGVDRVLVLIPTGERHSARRAAVEEQMRTLGWNNLDFIVYDQEAADRGKVVLLGACAKR